VSVSIFIPGPLRRYCAGVKRLTTESSSVRAALDEIEHRHPALYSGICDETGAVRRHVNVFVNESHIRDRQGLETPLAPGTRW
jgi:molybdopterin synthase sulfur carrier subunit